MISLVEDKSIPEASRDNSLIDSSIVVLISVYKIKYFEKSCKCKLCADLVPADPERSQE